MGPFVRGIKEITYHLSLCQKYPAANKTHPLPPGHNLQIKISVSDSDKYSWNLGNLRRSIKYLGLLKTDIFQVFFLKR